MYNLNKTNAQKCITEGKNFKKQDNRRGFAIMVDLEDNTIWTDIFVSENEWNNYKKESIKNVSGFLNYIGAELTAENILKYSKEEYFIV